MNDFGVFLEGFEIKDDLEETANKLRTAAYRAINAGAKRGRTLAVREMTDQVNFPAGYFRGEKSRLTVSKRASSASLEAVISGRDRPTSLARFVTSGAPRRQGVTVSVARGKSTTLERAFLMPLRSGMELMNNMGLAIRLPKGTKPRAAYRPVKLAEGLWLLYGPSVDQVFKSVRGDIAPDVSTYLETEFLRLLDTNI